MPPTRLVIPGVPLHITHRGVNRCATFLSPEDYGFYRWAVLQASTKAGCAVHAYVLMSNHTHLLLTPTAANSAARFMGSLGRRYVRYFNDRYRRTGTLWEGRFRSTVVSTRNYYLACARYIESNPVRARMVDAPEAYDWSSYRHNAMGWRDPLITEHSIYTALGPTDTLRRAAYRELFAKTLQDDEMATIRAPLCVRPRHDSVAESNGASAQD